MTFCPIGLPVRSRGSLPNSPAVCSGERPRTKEVPRSVPRLAEEAWPPLPVAGRRAEPFQVGWVRVGGLLDHGAVVTHADGSRRAGSGGGAEPRRAAALSGGTHDLDILRAVLRHALDRQDGIASSPMRHVQASVRARLQ